MHVYLAGPMTGIVDFNFPLFNAKAAELRKRGFTVSNPAEIVTDINTSWAECMRRDIPELVKCDAICLLPGWANSRGARLEASIADALGMAVIEEGIGDTHLFPFMPDARTMRASKALYDETMQTP